MLTVKTIQSLRHLSKKGFKPFPKTGRGRSIIPTNKDLPRLDVCMQRIYTRQHTLRFGADAALQDTMLMLEATKSFKVRKLDSKKKKQFETLLTEHLFFVSNEDPTISTNSILFTRVEVSSNFDKIKVYWQCKGDETDKETQEMLESSSYRIWLKLCECFHNATLPKLTFVPDKSHLWQQEIERILKTADYGLNYINKDKISEKKK